MAAITNTRVNIEYGKFERTIPLALESLITQDQWDTFASSVNDVFEKNKNITNKLFSSWKFMGVGPLVGMVLFGIGLFMTLRSPEHKVSPLIPVGIAVAFVIPIFGFCSFSGIISSFVRGHQEQQESFGKIAEDFSAKLPNVTVHYKQDKIPYQYYQPSHDHGHVGTTHHHGGYATGLSVQPYFEFSYRSGDIETAAAVLAEPEIPVLPATVLGTSADNQNKTTRERLDDLEKLKGEISEAEYNQARTNILSSL